MTLTWRTRLLIYRYHMSVCRWRKCEPAYQDKYLSVIVRPLMDVLSDAFRTMCWRTFVRQNHQYSEGFCYDDYTWLGQRTYIEPVLIRPISTLNWDKRLGLSRQTWVDNGLQWVGKNVGQQLRSQRVLEARWMIRYFVHRGLPLELLGTVIHDLRSRSLPVECTHSRCNEILVRLIHFFHETRSD